MRVDPNPTHLNGIKKTLEPQPTDILYRPDWWGKLAFDGSLLLSHNKVKKKMLSSIIASTLILIWHLILFHTTPPQQQTISYGCEKKKKKSIRLKYERYIMYKLICRILLQSNITSCPWAREGVHLCNV